MRSSKTVEVDGGKGNEDERTPAQVALLYGTLNKSSAVSYVPNQKTARQFVIPKPSLLTNGQPTPALPSPLLNSEWLVMTHSFSGSYTSYNNDLSVLNQLYHTHDPTVYPDVHSGEKLRKRVWQVSATKIQALWRGTRIRSQPLQTVLQNLSRAPKVNLKHPTTHSRKDVALLKQAHQQVIRERGVVNGVSLDDFGKWLEVKALTSSRRLNQIYPEISLRTEAVLTELRLGGRNQNKGLNVDAFVLYFLEEVTDVEFRSRVLNILGLLLSQRQVDLNEHSDDILALENLYKYIAKQHGEPIHCRTLAESLVDLSASGIRGAEVRQILSLGENNGTVRSIDFVRFCLDLKLSVPHSKLAKEIYRLAQNLGRARSKEAVHRFVTTESPELSLERSSRSTSVSKTPLTSSLKGPASSLALKYYAKS